MGSRLTDYIRAGVSLHKGGMTLGSILLFPFRHRFLHPRCEVTSKNGVTIVSPPEEPLLSMFLDIWVTSCYAPCPLDLPRGATVIDVGAHVGLFALWVAASHPEARVIALEPAPGICGFLRDNVSRNRLENITVVQAACGGRRGEELLYSRGPGAMNTFYARDLYGSQFRPLGRTLVLTLDDVFERFAVESCAFLKLDCEGAEYEILLNASAATLRKVERISLEYHIGLNDHAPQELVDFLASRGFEVTLLPPQDVESGYLHAGRRK
jgi:FkbM family methyltransferase